MRIPKNKIQTGKYTSGNEFVIAETNQSYQGHYYEFNNKFYTGRDYNPDAEEIIRIQQQNQLYNTPGTGIFSFISGITSQALSTPNIPSLPIQSGGLFLGNGNNTTTRYFSQQVNVKPTTIKEISKDTYELLQGNILFITTFISSTQSIDQANKQMPGLKEWLLG